MSRRDTNPILTNLYLCHVPTFYIILNQRATGSLTGKVIWKKKPDRFVSSILLSSAFPLIMRPSTEIFYPLVVIFCPYKVGIDNTTEKENDVDRSVYALLCSVECWNATGHSSAAPDTEAERPGPWTFLFFPSLFLVQSVRHEFYTCGSAKGASELCTEIEIAHKRN